MECDLMALLEEAQRMADMTGRPVKMYDGSVLVGEVVPLEFDDVGVRPAV